MPYLLQKILRLCKDRVERFLKIPDLRLGLKVDLRLDLFTDPVTDPAWFPSHIKLQIRCPKNHSSRTLQSRNFGYNKYFVANPKIKIIRIIEINTLVAFILQSYHPQYAISEIPLFLGVLAEIPAPI